MKALILAGGRGNRLNELSAKKNKCMIPVNGKPTIEYSLDLLCSTHITEFVIVFGYCAEEIIKHLGNSYRGKRIQYVIQSEQMGLVNAMECAREALDGDDFLLMLGDEILINARHRQMLALFCSVDIFAICGVLQVHDRDLIRRTYTLIEDNDHIISRLVEKPRIPFNDLMGTGNCVFRNQIFDYVDVTPLHHTRQEKELPDLIQCAIDDGRQVKSFIICDQYANVNSKEDLETAQSFFKR